MTLSNFDWTDKTSIRWFIMLPTGHEGPYTLNALVLKGTSPEIMIWAEGLSSPVRLKVALQHAQMSVAAPLEDDDELPPPLPPLPTEDEMDGELPELPGKKTLSSTQKIGGAVIGFLALFGFGLAQWVQTQEEFSIRRSEKMSPQLFSRIKNDFKFSGWNKRLFFKEYVSSDMSHIWLVTSGFQNCQVDAQFKSLKGKLLSNDDDEVVSFKTSGELTNHVVEFTNLDFSSGTKVVPGLYEMDLKAHDCSWDGIVPMLANTFKSPEESYVTRMKVVLFHQGPAEFNQVLDKLIRKKIDIQLKSQNQEELFWQDVQQKLQTLLAISLQIEQQMLDFLEKDPAAFQKNLKPFVDEYTKKFGHFLTGFVVANEEYFKTLDTSALTKVSIKKSYELIVRTTAKNVGFEAMRFIEELQKLKKPSKKDLLAIEARVKKKFEEQKDIINHKIIQVSEDRSK